MDRGENGYIYMFFFFFSNVVRIYVFKRKEWRGGNGIYTLHVCTKKCFQVVYYQPLLLDMFWGLQSKVAGTGKKLVTRPKVNLRQANRILSHAKPVTFCFPFHFTFNTIPSESSLARIAKLSELLSGRYPSSGRLLLSTLSAHQTFSTSAHWHETSTREKVNTALNLKKLDIAAAEDLL